MPDFEGGPVSLVESAAVAGFNLTEPNQSISDAVGQLNIDLLVLGCEPQVTREGVAGSWESVFLRPNTQPFSRAVRAGARAIILRENTQHENLGPEYRESTPELVEQVMVGTLEGAVWIDPEAANFRKRIAKQNALLLGGFITGLAEGGYKPRRARRDVREEFDEILDSLWARGSYSSFGASRTIAATMRLSDVGNVVSAAHGVRRASRFAREYGVGQAIVRLLPDELAAAALGKE